MKKIYIIFAAIFVGMIVVACASLKFGATYCHPKVGCVGLDLEIKCDTCK